MILRDGPQTQRELKTGQLDCGLTIVGGGLAGTCCAITAARAGVKVVLVHDRPVLGGNASSEVRLWVVGATAHMGSNNRWAREGGVVDEILVENMWRNPEGNPIIFDSILLEKVAAEPNIRLLLNTAVHDLAKGSPQEIRSVRAFCSQNSTVYEIRSPLFCDASGDGIVGFLAGAAFRMGAEAREEFDEAFAPSREFGELLGHSLYFYSRDTGRPVTFVAPEFALRDITAIPRYRQFNAREHGCRLWWIEYGGRLDTVHDTETIKWELWRIVYGVWDYIKNSGNFPDVANLTLDWVGMIPGKRESRRFEGPYMLRQQDVIQQRLHRDAVAYGGWSIELHPADGIFSEHTGNTAWHARGMYQIPYRCLFSRNIENLFLAGRIISASHVAFGSSRMMATCAHAAQAVGRAAALCLKGDLLPADVAAEPHMGQLQRELLKTGQHIPGIALRDMEDLAHQAQISASSELLLGPLPDGGLPQRLDRSWAQLLPAQRGLMPRVTLSVDVEAATELRVELRTSNRADNHTPDVLLERRSINLRAGIAQSVTVDFGCRLDEARYVFVCLMANPDVLVHTSPLRVTGLLSVTHHATQTPPEGIGIEPLEFWAPQRRPRGQYMAMRIDPPLAAFSASNVANGWQRPTFGANAWVADPADPHPTLTLAFGEPHPIGRIDLFFDCDHDHSMESVLMGHPERAMPFCVKRYRIVDGRGSVLYACDENHHAHNTVVFEPAVFADKLVIEVQATFGAPAAIFEVRCYPPQR